MNIHRYEKIWLGAAMVMIVLFIGTVTYGSAVAGVSMLDDQEEVVDPQNLDEEFPEPGVEQVGEDEYVVHVIAYQFFFDPGTFDPIEVPGGSEVTFKVTSADVIHSFSIVGTNANTMVIPGEIASMTVETPDVDEEVRYGILCNEYCGAGHHDMEAAVVVVPSEEFELEGET